jgi:FkbM family methyltransferase
MIASLQSLIHRPQRDCIYDILAHLEPGLCLDIGAAAGHETRRIALAGGPGTSVVAFEPFPGNHKFFLEATRSLGDRVRLVTNAVSDRVGTADFTVPSIVHAGTTGWERFEGYSSVGYLSRRRGLMHRALRGMLSMLRGRPSGRRLSVDTTTIDTEFPAGPIAFVKIDVQGAEPQVLRGAARALADRRIDLLYIEWSGDPAVVQALEEPGYAIYDSLYVVGPKNADVGAFERIGFIHVADIHLSTGRTAFELLLPAGALAPEHAIAEVKKRNLGWIQTDLIAVSPLMRERFAAAVTAYCRTPITR